MGIEQTSIDLMAAPREHVEQILTAQRDEIMFRIIRLMGQLGTVNLNRFPLDKIEIDLDFSKQMKVFMEMEDAEKLRIFQNALNVLSAIENPEPKSRIITPDQVRAEQNDGNGGILH